MTLVLACAVRGGVLVAGDTLVNTSTSLGSTTASTMPGGKVFAIGKRFAVVTYGGYAGYPNVPTRMAGLTPLADETTAAFAKRLMDIFREPRAGNTMRALVAGIDGKVYRIIEADLDVQALRTGGDCGFWSGSVWGEDSTLLPGWPVGISPAEKAAQLNRQMAREFAAGLIKAGATAQPAYVGPEMEALVVTSAGVEVA